MALTAAAIKNAKGRTKPNKLTDSDGLVLYVAPNGGRYWRMNYRYMGKQKTLAFGVYADIGLADAREQRDAARKMLARGADPAEKIKLDRLAVTVAAANSFEAVAFVHQASIAAILSVFRAASSFCRTSNVASNTSAFIVAWRRDDHECPAPLREQRE